METGDKMMRARCRLMVREPFYGHVAMSVEWMESKMDWMPEHSRTAGVRIIDGGRIQCLYNPGFINELTVEQCYGLIMHELEHVIRLHPVRLGSRDPQKFNIAADICVNGKRSNPRCCYKENTSKVIVPSEQGIFCPEDWSDELTAEEYYEKFPEDMDPSEHQCGGDGDGDGDGDDGDDGDGDDDGDGKQQQKGGGKQKPKGNKTNPKIKGQLMDNHDLWRDSNVSEDEARQVVKDMVDQASEKSMGKVPGHLKEWLKQLAKPVVNWRDILRKYIGRHCGNRRSTYSRRNRRRDEFGMKGFSHHASSTMNVIIDTSGSVSQEELQQFFAEIEAAAYRTKIRVLQWDHAFQGYTKYRRGDWKDFQIHGRGGTDMVAPVEWLKENKLVADVQLMLTDGECHWPQPQNFPMLFAISSRRSSYMKPPTWGEVIYLDKHK